VKTAHAARTGRRYSLPRAVWALGIVSLFMDTSSELIHGLLPILLVGTLGASTFAVGLIEGTAEATAAIVKVFSGSISDWVGRRKPLVLLGYGLAAATKPLFPLASTVGLVLAAHLVDRAGKGIRGAPRDALIADVIRAEQRGAAFGLRQALDTVGAVLGPLLAIALMVWLAGDVRAVLWFAVPPAAIAVLVLAFLVAEPERHDGAPKMVLPISRMAFGRLPRGYWWIVVVGAVLTLARFSEAFLILRARNVGVPTAWIPIVFVVMSAVYASASYPAGLLSDRMNRPDMLRSGVAVLIVADLALAYWPSPLGAMAGAALWGLHMGLTQGLQSALVADAAPAELRGTAFGLFNLVCGAMSLLASVLAGLLWDRVGPQATFLAGAGFTALALLGMAAYRRPHLPTAPTRSA